MLELVPISYEDACSFTKKHHRHHKPPQGHKYSIAAFDGTDIVGVVMVGRPVSQSLDNGMTLEVTRLCTNGRKNTCSFLYSAAWRVAKNLGYKKLITYILHSETGISLSATGWKCLGEAGGGTWHRKNRPRIDKHSIERKIKYEIAV